jgi:hypothetical protein
MILAIFTLTIKFTNLTVGSEAWSCRTDPTGRLPSLCVHISHGSVRIRGRLYGLCGYIKDQKSQLFLRRIKINFHFIAPVKS